MKTYKIHNTGKNVMALGSAAPRTHVGAIPPVNIISQLDLNTMVSMVSCVLQLWYRLPSLVCVLHCNDVPAAIHYQDVGQD